MTARVLVVDDIELNVKVLKAKLTAEYFDVSSAMSGEEALELIERQPPDIVLLDVMMPGLDGIEVCRRIRANPNTAQLPVVMVTALSEPVDRVRGLEAGADDFLTKPIDDVALLARVRTLVRLKTMEDEWRLREETSNQLGLTSDETRNYSSDLNGAQVLVIEDDPRDARIIEETLSDRCSVRIEADGERAVSLAHQEEFDFVIVSLMHRTSDGLRLCSQLRTTENTRQMSLLALVPEDETESLAKAFEIGVNDYLVKPINRNELHARTETQIRRKFYQDRLRENYQERIVMAVTDTLTGLHNRRYLLSHLENLVRRAADGGKPVSVLMIDIDHFKRINDTYGHQIGDEVMIESARRMRLNVRGVDLAVRYGGEEFVVVMPDTELSVANIVAERLTQNFAGEPFKISDKVGEITVTVSAGVAVTLGAGDTAEKILHRADEALYSAKREGRNRVVAIAG